MTAGPVVVGTGPLRVLVDPARGGRVLSLHSDGREWLAPSTAADLDRVPDAHSPFVRPGMGGWDEVIPTVAATVLPDGRRLSDHGEAWRRPWTVVSVTPTSVVAALHLADLPVTLHRALSVHGRELRADYRVVVDPGVTVDTPLLWSAHPQFAASEGTRVELGRGVLALGVQYPEGAPTLDFDDDDVLATLAPGTAIKAFAPSDVRLDRVRLRHRDGATLTMSWDPAEVPYLGLWWDNGLCADGPVIAVEPCTGYGDDAAAALRAGRLSVLPPGGVATWSLYVEVSPAADPAGAVARAVVTTGSSS